MRYRHGMTRTPVYRAWVAMLQRCTNPNLPGYSEYGGRGITVCERWRDFVNFNADMGAKPTPKHSLDRIDNNGNYEPDNCRWSTPKEQINNQRHRKGRTLTLMKLSITGL